MSLNIVNGVSSSCFPLNGPEDIVNCFNLEQGMNAIGSPYRQKESMRQSFECLCSGYNEAKSYWGVPPNPNALPGFSWAGFAWAEKKVVEISKNVLEGLPSVAESLKLEEVAQKVPMAMVAGAVTAFALAASFCVVGYMLDSMKPDMSPGGTYDRKIFQVGKVCNLPLVVK